MSNDFKRSRLMFAAIQAAMSLPFAEKATAMSLIPQYHSRGHGKNKPFIKSCMSLSSRAGSSKYQPHQGKRECERRMGAYHG